MEMTKEIKKEYEKLVVKLAQQRIKIVEAEKLVEKEKKELQILEDEYSDYIKYFI